MSKNITIKKDGVAQNFNNVSRISLKKVSGGTVYFVPKDSTDLSDINITANGTYKASDAGVFGYETINVNVPINTNSITGIDKTTGNTVTVTVGNDSRITRS